MRSSGTDEAYRARWLGLVKRIKRQQPNLQTDADIANAIIDLIVADRSQLCKSSFRQYRQGVLYGLDLAIGIDETLRFHLQDQLYEFGDYTQNERPLATSSPNEKNLAENDLHRLCAFLSESKVASEGLLLNFLRANLNADLRPSEWLKTRLIVNEKHSFAALIVPILCVHRNQS